MEWLVAVALAVIGAGVAYLKGRQEGRKHEESSARQRDQARADRIRDDVRRSRDGGVRPEDIRYRD